MYYIVLSCIILYCILLNIYILYIFSICIVLQLQYIISYYNIFFILYWVVIYFIIINGIVLYCIVLYFILFWPFTYSIHTHQTLYIKMYRYIDIITRLCLQHICHWAWGQRQWKLNMGCFRPFIIMVTESVVGWIAARQGQCRWSSDLDATSASS